MSEKSFSTTILVNQSPKEVFDAVNNVQDWWSEEVTGGTTKIGDEFDYHYKDVHICKMRLIEVIPNQKVVWLVLENYFDFTKDKSEWMGNHIIFDITQKGAQTELHFTHQGLVPSYECYQICNDAWTGYITGSLKNLISTGKGAPNPKEN
jgi:hypothetical protein